MIQTPADAARLLRDERQHHEDIVSWMEQRTQRLLLLQLERDILAKELIVLRDIPSIRHRIDATFLCAGLRIGAEGQIERAPSRTPAEVASGSWSSFDFTVEK